MNYLLEKTAQDIMTPQPICSYPDMIMTEVAEIFESNDFHHLPVIDTDNECIGMISKSDYYQLQDKFTKFGSGRCKKGNTRFFASLLASEVMTAFPVSVDINASMDEVNSIFLKNKIHSVVVQENGKFRGIITPYDIMELLSVYYQNEETWLEQ